MSFFSFFNIFNKSSVNEKNNTEDDPSEHVPLPGTQLFFDKSLIDNLQNDHEDLLKIYGEIANVLTENNLEKLPDLFSTFSSRLRGHILVENVKLYVYLTYALENDPESLEIIIELRSEMQQIGRLVNNFLSQYSELPWTEEKSQSFPVEFEKTGKILVDRIKREEHNLYPLYLHPDAYLNATEKA